MKPKTDAGVAEVRLARRGMCERFGNDLRLLVGYLRGEQEKHKGKVIHRWQEAHAPLLHDKPMSRRKR